MKTLIALASLALVLALASFAATRPTPTPRPPPSGGSGIGYCIDVNGDMARVTEAFGWIHQLKDENGNLRPATSEEMEIYIYRWVEAQTHDYERRKNMREFTPPPFGNESKYAEPGQNVITSIPPTPLPGTRMPQNALLTPSAPKVTPTPKKN